MKIETRREDRQAPNGVATLRRYAWTVAFLCARAHYFLTSVVGPVFGWR